ncbi:MAG: hypothetical protein ACRC7N_16545 [Clostridium sp.]
MKNLTKKQKKVERRETIFAIMSCTLFLIMLIVLLLAIYNPDFQNLK